MGVFTGAIALILGTLALQALFPQDSPTSLPRETVTVTHTPSSISTPTNPSQAPTEAETGGSTSLFERPLIDSKRYNEYHQGGTLFQDSYGNRYNECHSFSAGNYTTSYAVYNLDRNYTYFNALIVGSSEIRSENTFVIRVLLDEKQIFIKDDFTKRTEPFPLSIPITDALRLTVEVSLVNDYWQSDEGSTIYLVNATVS
jgi:hypothetical protein